MDGVLEQIRLAEQNRRREYRRIRPGRSQPALQRARLETGAIRRGGCSSTLKPRSRKFRRAVSRDLTGFVGGIIQHLDLQQFARIIQVR